MANLHTAIYIGIVYSYLPFMVLPIYSTLEKMDETLLEAAIDLGCPAPDSLLAGDAAAGASGHCRRLLPRLHPNVGEFVIPDLLGGSGDDDDGPDAWTEFFSNRDWPVASAIAIVLLASLIVPILFYERLQQRSLEGGRRMKRGASPVQHHRGRASAWRSSTCRSCCSSSIASTRRGS